MSDITPVTPTLPYRTPHAPGAGRVFVAAYLANLNSANSRRNMARYLDTAASVLLGAPASAEDVSWPGISYIHVTALKTALGARYAPNTVNGVLSAVRGVLRACWLAGAVTSDEYQRAAAVSGMPVSESMRGRHLERSQVRDVLEAARNMSQIAPARAARDYAILALMFGAGLRRSEVVALDVWDYDTATGRVDIRRAKGHKDRVTFANVEARRALLAWLDVRAAARVTDTGALFVRVTRQDTPAKSGRLSAEAIYQIFRHYGQAAGLEGLSPHDARRTFIGTALDAGIGGEVISRAVGHSSTDTTRRYDRRGERAVAEMSERIRY